MWAIRTMTQIGNRLKQMHKFPSGGLIELTQFWIDQEVPSKVSNLIVSGILFGLENEQPEGVDFLMQEALRKQFRFRSPKTSLSCRISSTHF